MSLPGVCAGIASLNFGASGRVGSLRVHLGQTVRKGEVLATEAGAPSTAAVRADRAAITADKANLAALQADGSAAASIIAAQAQPERTVPTGPRQVSLLIPQTGTSAVKVGEDVTISVPAAQLSEVKGTIRELSPMPVSSWGGAAAYEAVVRVLGRTWITPLSGMTANVQLGSLRLQGQAPGVKRSG